MDSIGALIGTLIQQIGPPSTAKTVAGAIVADIVADIPFYITLFQTLPDEPDEQAEVITDALILRLWDDVDQHVPGFSGLDESERDEFNRALRTVVLTVVDIVIASTDSETGVKLAAPTKTAGEVLVDAAPRQTATARAIAGQVFRPTTLRRANKWRNRRKQRRQAAARTGPPGPPADTGE